MCSKIFCDWNAVFLDVIQQEGDKNGKVYYRGDTFSVPGLFV
jgi:hypothetical protein